MGASSTDKFNSYYSNNLELNFTNSKIKKDLRKRA